MCRPGRAEVGCWRETTSEEKSIWRVLKARDGAVSMVAAPDTEYCIDSTYEGRIARWQSVRKCPDEAWLQVETGDNGVKLAEESKNSKAAWRFLNRHSPARRACLSDLSRRNFSSSSRARASSSCSRRSLSSSTDRKKSETSSDMVGRVYRRQEPGFQALQ